MDLVLLECFDHIFGSGEPLETLRWRAKGRCCAMAG